MSKSKSKKMRNQANDLADRISPHVESAREKAGPLIAEAREKAGPVIAEAREKAGPTLADAREKLSTEVVPVLTAAIAAAGEATEDARSEAKKRGAAAAAALKGEVEAPKKRHRLRKFVIFLGLGGIAAAVAKKLSDRQASTAWQSSYQPTPAAAPKADDTPTATAAAASSGKKPDDEAASTPDEAAADAAETPHKATTPDKPVEEVDVKKK